MRIFLTGATGFIGSAIVPELISAGHQVLGLVRSEEKAKSLRDAGADVHFGSIDDLDSLKRGAEAADGVIHTAFIHDFTRYKESCEKDRKVIEAMGSVLAGTKKPLVITSGTALLQRGRLTTESSGLASDSDTVPRAASEEAAAAVAEKGVAVSSIRLAPSVHGKGDIGFVPMLINMARQKGVSAYIGEGLNHWPAVHRFDAARLFMLALESGAAQPVYHSVAEEGIPFREIAMVIGKRLNIPVVSIAPNEAATHFGWFANFAGLDNTCSSEQTQKALGWKPTEIGLLADIDSDYYFKG